MSSCQADTRQRPDRDPTARQHPTRTRHGLDLSICPQERPAASAAAAMARPASVVMRSLDTSTPPVESANTALPVCTISDMSLHHCLPEYFCIARFNPCVILENTLSHFFEKHPRRGGLGTYVQHGLMLWCARHSTTSVHNL